MMQMTVEKENDERRAGCGQTEVNRKKKGKSNDGCDSSSHPVSSATHFMVFC